MQEGGFDLGVSELPSRRARGVHSLLSGAGGGRDSPLNTLGPSARRGNVGAALPTEEKTVFRP